MAKSVSDAGIVSLCIVSHPAVLMRGDMDCRETLAMTTG